LRQRFGGEKIHQLLLSGHCVNSLAAKLHPASSGVIATVIKTGRIVLDVRTAVMFVNDGKQDVVHPYPEIFIAKPVRLLRFSIEMG
jgi:hypothetical protein